MSEEIEFFDEVSWAIANGVRPIRLVLVSGEKHFIDEPDHCETFSGVIYIVTRDGRQIAFPLYQVCSIELNAKKDEENASPRIP